MSFMIEKYTKANYKKSLSFEERANMVNSAVNLAIQLMDNEVYGMTRYAFLTSLVSHCTDIDLSELTPDEKWILCSESPILKHITINIGDEQVKDLQKEFDTALKYRLSTNPAAKELMLSLAEFLSKMGSEDRQQKNIEAVTALLSLARGEHDEDKHS